MMKYFFILILFFNSCSISKNKKIKNNKKTNEYVFISHKKGKLKTDTITIKNKKLSSEMNRLLKEGKDFKPNFKDNDTIFNGFRKPKIVKLGNTFFGATYKKYEYNILKLKTKITGYNEKNEISPFYQDLSEIRFKYDENGNEIEIRYFDKNLKPLRIDLLGPAIQINKYDKNNNIIEIQFLDENGNFVQKLGKIKYKYENGKKVLTEKYNGNNELIK